MSMYVLGPILVAAAVETGSAVNGIITEGSNLGNMGAAAIWATVALVSIIGLVRLYWDQKTDKETLQSIIKDSSTCIQKNSDCLDKLSSRIDACQKK